MLENTSKISQNKFLFHWDETTDVYESDLGWHAELIGDDEPLYYFLIELKCNVAFVYKGQDYAIDNCYFETLDSENPKFDNFWRLCKFKVNKNWDGKYLYQKFNPRDCEYFYFGTSNEEFYEKAEIDGVPIVEVLKQSYIYLWY